MTKERLAEIIDDLPYSVIKSGEMEELIVFAIEQADRVQELDKKNSDYWLENDTLHKSVRYLQQQNKRYREAIEKAINKLTWNSIESEQILLEALESESNEN